MEKQLKVFGYYVDDIPNECLPTTRWNREAWKKEMRKLEDEGKIDEVKRIIKPYLI